MKRVLLVALVTLMVAGFPQPGSATQVTGAFLLKLCDSSFEKCLFYVGGVTDGYQLGRSHAKGKPIICPPAGSDKTQAARIVHKYVRDHPEDHHLPAKIIVINAMARTFPCN